MWAPDSSVPAVGDGHDDLRYVRIARDNVIQNVTAAGTLEAVDTVEVSSQLSGQVAKLTADYNSRVRAGEPLAALDSATFEVLVKEAEAALTVAQAQHEEARAAVEGAQAHHEDALRDLQVKSTLSKNGSVSQRDAERAQVAARSLAAELSATKAREQVRAAGVMAARASLERARLDLERSTIKSPIDGVVIRRSVELGQTVAVSLQAPTLFTIARDLSDMRVNASVSEADIGAVRTGQRALFGVDSYPGRSFEGRVLEIRKAARMVQKRGDLYRDDFGAQSGRFAASGDDGRRAHRDPGATRRDGRPQRRAEFSAGRRKQLRPRKGGDLGSHEAGPSGPRHRLTGRH